MEFFFSIGAGVAAAGVVGMAVRVPREMSRNLDSGFGALAGAGDGAAGFAGANSGAGGSAGGNAGDGTEGGTTSGAGGSGAGASAGGGAGGGNWIAFGRSASVC